METPKAAAVRELKEEANLLVKECDVVDVGVFEGGGRDPRDNEESWSKSYAFLYKVEKEEYKKMLNEAYAVSEINAVGWFSEKEIEKMSIAFDHVKIIKAGFNMIFKTENKNKFKM